MFKKVLLATDFSPPAEQLYELLEEFKRVGMEEVVLLYVVRLSGVARRFQEKASEKLMAKKKELEEKGFQVKAYTPIGFPAQEIQKLADKEDVSLILIGSVGESFLRRIFLGSTASDLIRTSNKPIFLEKYRELEEEGEYQRIGDNKFEKILFPTDFSGPSYRIYEKIKALKDVTKEVILVHVIDKGVSDEEISKLRKETRKKLNEMKEELEEVGIRSEIRIRTGTPSDNIVRIGEEDVVSLIVIPSRGEGLIKEILLGSTAENVARRSKRPVLIFPERI
ncbi:MAG: universal stress protein [Candidatus Syntrophonatronum acetioxidans]|uniref:Universal stress protein n=1 Tax=Candidatus Syntrophonatronum acetioxidans TaxID=1795816 RepID=A0A424YIB7_9FIRM|nr:MAG: universal stress protein [Candidatus Syntrophonatronum acetioxidans]